VAFGPCPIEACLGELFKLQAASCRQDDPTAWLIDVDVNCDAVVQITRKEGVMARGRWELFREETGSTMSITRFGMEMTRLVADPMVPFDQKVRPMRGAFYPVKARGS